MTADAAVFSRESLASKIALGLGVGAAIGIIAIVVFSVPLNIERI